jgi:hypothetical protein
MKIIANRLDKCLTNRQVLQDNNWAGTSGGTTTKPRLVLNNLIEDAKENDKEIWILLQDTKKAFDSVGSSSIKAALERINIPKQIINLLMNMRRDRTADVITAGGTTDKYNIQDGLDQGDPISPLLWKIFYDPLIAKVNKMREGYKMSASITNNFRTGEQQQKSESLNNLVYMDDTTWVAGNGKEMDRILQMAEEFYWINDIQVNKDKTKLVIVNRKEREKKREVTLMGTKIRAQEETKAERFLGSWIQGKKGRTTQVMKTEYIVLQNIREIERKKLTPKISSYLINSVIAPAVDYMITDVYIDEARIHRWQKRLDTSFKRQYKLSQTTPEATLRLKQLANIVNLKEKIVQNRLRSMDIILEDKNILRKTTEIRLMQLQKDSWSVKKVTENEGYLNRKSKNSLVANVLYTCRKEGFEVQRGSWAKELKIEGGMIAIEELWSEEQYRENKRNMKKWRVLYVDQLIQEGKEEIMDWKYINPSRGEKRKTPAWYRLAKEGWEMKKSKILEKLKKQKRKMQQIVMPRVNKYGDMKRIKWLAFKEGKEMVIGRKRKRLDEEWLVMEHYVEDEETKEITKCMGCESNERYIQNGCSRKKNIQQSWSPVVKKIKMAGEGSDSQRLIKIRTQTGEPTETGKIEEKSQRKGKRIKKEKEITIIADAAWDKREGKECGA